MISLIPSWLLVIVFAAAAAVKIRAKQYEHAFVRIIIFLFYLYIECSPGVPIEVTRSVSRYLWFLLATIEVFSYFVIAYQRKKAKPL